MTDLEIRQAVERRLSALDSDSQRSLRILRKIENGEEPKMKKKLSLGLVLGIALIAVFAAVAFAASANLFYFFGQRDERYEKVADRAALETAAPLTAQGDSTGARIAGFDSAIYDGMTLNVALAIEKTPEVEEMTPDAETLSTMNVMAELPVWTSWDNSSEKATAIKKLAAAMEAGVPYGCLISEYFPSDHITTDDGTDIPPDSGDCVVDESGRYMEMREFESPLPESLRNLDAITLNCKIYRQEQIWYFDGETLYRQVKSTEAGVIRATAPRSGGAVIQMSDAGNAAVTAAAEVSAMSAVAELQGPEGITLLALLGENARVPAGVDDADAWIEIDARDEQGREYRGASWFSPDQTLPVTQVLTGVGVLPETLTIVIRLRWEGEAENQIKPFTIALKAENGD